jgi:hypothetical protein
MDSLRSLLLIAALVVSSGCSLTGESALVGRATAYELSNLTGSTSSGTLKYIALSDGTSAATLSLSGLKPGAPYTAQWVARDATDPESCTSSRKVLEAFQPFSVDALGNATARLFSQTAREQEALLRVSSGATPLLCADFESSGTVLSDITTASVTRRLLPSSGGSAMGTIRITVLSDGATAATLALNGLQPNTDHVAHYHALGDGKTPTCASSGALSLAFPSFASDASGNATVRLLSDTFVTAGARGGLVDVHPVDAPTDTTLCAILEPL